MPGNTKKGIPNANTKPYNPMDYIDPNKTTNQYLLITKPPTYPVYVPNDAKTKESNKNAKSQNKKTTNNSKSKKQNNTKSSSKKKNDTNNQKKESPNSGLESYYDSEYGYMTPDMEVTAKAPENDPRNNQSTLLDREDVTNTSTSMINSIRKYLNPLNNLKQPRKFESNEQNLDFLIPQYGVSNFICERALWQKGIHNLTGEPGWFYFKIFFNFKDSKGLFGGIMDNEMPTTSAIRYLFGIRKFYDNSRIYDRILALARFTYTLAYINSISPWFFIGMNNVNKLNSLDLNELTKEKSIDIVCNGEAIDLRLSTLLDMYRYACYDEINQKEILPENLRKFDMSIIIMNAPIKYFQTAMMTSANMSKLGSVGHNGSTVLNKVISGINKVAGLMAGSTANTFDFKNINGMNDAQSIDNMLTFQMYSLKNCEIDPISFESYIPSNLTNTQFNKQGVGFIKIKYDRCYKHTFNEWTQMFYGTTGIMYDKTSKELINSHTNTLLGIALKDSPYNSDSNSSLFESNTITPIQDSRIAAIQKSIYNSFFDKDTEAYKGLIDFSEAVIKDSLINVKTPDYLGNIDENYDEKNWADLWTKTKTKFTNFFSQPLDIF